MGQAKSRGTVKERALLAIQQQKEERNRRKEERNKRLSMMTHQQRIELALWHIGVSSIINSIPSSRLTQININTMNHQNYHWK